MLKQVIQVGIFFYQILFIYRQQFAYDAQISRNRHLPVETAVHRHNRTLRSGYVFSRITLHKIPWIPGIQYFQ